MTSTTTDKEVLDWISDADPSLHWQVLRDLQGKPESEWAPVRARIETEGWGARLLAAQDADGFWAGDAFSPPSIPWSTWGEVGQPWIATSHVLTELRLLGLDASSASAKRTVDLLRSKMWDEFGTKFWEGEVEECINGRLLADGVALGVPVAELEPLATKLVEGAQEEGGWNCERERGSKRSSFDSTICVLEGLLAYERAGGSVPGMKEARKAGEEYLLKRGLFRRASTGECPVPAYLELTDEPRWRYDVLRGLEYFREAATYDRKHPDSRLKEAVEHVKKLRTEDGKWKVQRRFKGAATFHVGEVGDASPIITTRAMRVLKWWDEAGQ